MSLPREQNIIEPTEDVTEWKIIGQEITEELERTPGKLFVRQYVRNKYLKPDGEAIVTGELPSGITKHASGSISWGIFVF